MTDLAKLRELSDAATPGEWDWHASNLTMVGVRTSDPMYAHNVGQMFGWPETAAHNAAFIVACVNHVRFQLSHPDPAPGLAEALPGTVYVNVSGLTGTGKSAICGEIEILCAALGLPVEWTNGQAEKNLTHADWIAALEMYQPRVVIEETNIPRKDPK